MPDHLWSDLWRDGRDNTVNWGCSFPPPEGTGGLLWFPPDGRVVMTSSLTSLLFSLAILFVSGQSSLVLWSFPSATPTYLLTWCTPPFMHKNILYHISRYNCMSAMYLNLCVACSCLCSTCGWPGASFFWDCMPVKLVILCHWDHAIVSIILRYMVVIWFR